MEPYRTKMGRPLGELLKELRRRIGLTQGQFAAQLEVSENTIQQVECGTLAAPQSVLDAYGQLAWRQRRVTK